LRDGITPETPAGKAKNCDLYAKHTPSLLVHPTELPVVLSHFSGVNIPLPSSKTPSNTARMPTPSLNWLMPAMEVCACACAESFGAAFLVHEVAKACAIPKALGTSEDAKLALWQVCARVLAPATSLLAMIRLAGRCAAPAL
jgi:hypothetical protein